MGIRASKKADITAPPQKDKKLKRRKSKKEVASANGDSGIEEVGIQEKKEGGEIIENGGKPVEETQEAKKAETESAGSTDAPTDIVQDSPDKDAPSVAVISEVQTPSSQVSLVGEESKEKPEQTDPAVVEAKIETSTPAEKDTKEVPSSPDVAKPEVSEPVKEVSPVEEKKVEEVKVEDTPKPVTPVESKPTEPSPVTEVPPQEVKAVSEEKVTESPVEDVKVETTPVEPESVKSPVVESPVEVSKPESPVAVEPEPVVEKVPEPVVESPVEKAPEPVVESPVEKAPEPVVESPVEKAPEPAVESPVEKAPEPVVEAPVEEVSKPEQVDSATDVKEQVPNSPVAEVPVEDSSKPEDIVPEAVKSSVVESPKEENKTELPVSNEEVKSPVEEAKPEIVAPEEKTEATQAVESPVESKQPELPITNGQHDAGSPVTESGDKPVEVTTEKPEAPVENGQSDHSPLVDAAKETKTNGDLNGELEHEVPKEVETNQEQNVPTELVWKKGGDHVAISGDFNKWEDQHSLHKVDDIFSTKLKLSKGTHHLKYIVDGVETVDDTQPIIELDGHGQVNVLTVE